MRPTIAQQRATILAEEITRLGRIVGEEHVIIAVARRELRKAEVDGFCGFCFAAKEDGAKKLDACLPRKKRK